MQSETPPMAITQARNYPYNCWWVVALSDEVGRKLLSRKILEMPILLYRQEDGTPVAIEDRCPHRSAPLSMGTLRGDDVVCRYHGFEFAPTGKCIRVPTQGSPGRISARTYPLIEQYPFVWLYTGEVAVMDSVPKPMDAIAWGVDPSTVVVYGHVTIRANYLLLHENVLDLSHVPHVHATTLQDDRTYSAKFTTEGDVVTYASAVENAALPIFLSMGSEMASEQVYEQSNYGRFEAPVLVAHTTKFVQGDPHPAGIREYFSYICHAATPIDMGEMHYWWSTGRNYGRADSAFKAEYGNMISSAFEEDKAVLEAIQTIRTGNDRHPAREYSVAADAGGVSAREALQRRMARESYVPPKVD